MGTATDAYFWIVSKSRKHRRRSSDFGVWPGAGPGERQEFDI